MESIHTVFIHYCIHISWRAFLVKQMLLSKSLKSLPHLNNRFFFSPHGNTCVETTFHNMKVGFHTLTYVVEEESYSCGTCFWWETGLEILFFFHSICQPTQDYGGKRGKVLVRGNPPPLPIESSSRKRVWKDGAFIVVAPAAVGVANYINDEFDVLIRVCGIIGCDRRAGDWIAMPQAEEMVYTSNRWRNDEGCLANYMSRLASTGIRCNAGC